jgi:hypothetical protein
MVGLYKVRHCVKNGTMCLGFLRSIVHSLRSIVHSRLGEELSVLGRVRNIDQQPSAQPEFSDEHRKLQQKADIAIISGPDDVKKGVGDQARTSDKHDVSHPAGEDTPKDNGQTQKEEVDSRED